MATTPVSWGLSELGLLCEFHCRGHWALKVVVLKIFGSPHPVFVAWDPDTNGIYLINMANVSRFRKCGQPPKPPPKLNKLPSLDNLLGLLPGAGLSITEDSPVELSGTFQGTAEKPAFALWIQDTTDTEPLAVVWSRIFCVAFTDPKPLFEPEPPSEEPVAEEEGVRTGSEKGVPVTV